MSEECDMCSECGSTGCVEKVPSNILDVKLNVSNKTGSIVKKHIEDAKLEIKEEKKRLSSEVFKWYMDW